MKGKTWQNYFKPCLRTNAGVGYCHKKRRASCGEDRPAAGNEAADGGVGAAIPDL